MTFRTLLPLLFAAASSLSLPGQPYGPLQNVRFEAYDRGVVFFYENPEGYDPFSSDPRISQYQFRRDGGDPVVLFSNQIDAPLDPATTYHYQIFAVDSGGTVITATTDLSATTLPDGSGLTTSRVSLRADGSERAYASSSPSVSGDGRFVTYASYDTQGSEFQGDTQIHRLDRQTGETTVASTNADGTFADRNCSFPSISDDGRFITFNTEARNLSPVDTDFGNDVYLHDAQTGLLTLVTDAPGVGSDNDNISIPIPPIISADGSTVAFISNATNLKAEATVRRNRLYLYNVLTTELTLVADPAYTLSGYTTPGIVEQVALSGDGGLAVFTVAYQPTNGFSDTLRVIWLLDRTVESPGTISAITRQYNNNNQPATGFAYAPTISRDGRWVAFSWRQSFSKYHNIADPILGLPYTAQVGYLLDRQTDTLDVFTRGAAGGIAAAIGTHTARISISDDGQRIAFEGSNSGGYPLAVYDPTTNINIYVRDRSFGRTLIANRSSSGVFSEASRPASLAQLTADGQAVVYQSTSANLVEGDTNDLLDIFLTELDLAPPDTDAPTWPDDASLEATTIGATLVELAWSEAVDTGGSVTAYRIFGDGELIGETAAGERTLQVPALTPETTYAFRVEALDATGNISTTGPILEVTTRASTSGNAALSAPSLDGGRVQLAWDPAEDSVLGYVIQRRDTGGDWAGIGEVAPDITTFLDTGLPASASLSYRILLKPTVGDPAPHSATVSITTKALSIQTVVTTPILAANSRELLAIGGSLAVAMTAESGRTASATVAYERWVDLLDPSKGTEAASASTALSESGTTSGLFTGTWTLPAGTARITSVSGVLADGFGSGINLPASGFPRTVESAFAISVDASAEDFAKGLVFSLWSETLRVGCSQAINGSATIEKGGLPPGNDYRLRVLQGNRVVQTLTAVTLPSGLVTRLDQTLPATTSALFTLKDPDGNPRGGFLIGLFETDTDRFLGFGDVGPDGSVDAAPGLQFAPGSNVTYRLKRQPWDLDAGPKAVVIPDAATVGNLPLEWSDVRVPPARIVGRITNPDGSPARIRLQGASINPGIVHTVETTSADDGSYVLDPVFGRTFLNVAGSDRRRSLLYHEQEVDVTSGGTTTVDIQLELLTEYSIRIDSLNLRYPSGRVVTVAAGELPNIHSVQLRLIEDGRLFTTARETGDESGLSVHFASSPGTGYTILIDASALGFRTVTLPVIAAEEPVIVIPSLDLEMESSSFITARLADATGQPIAPDLPWALTFLSARTNGQRTDIRILGAGPEIELPVPENLDTLLNFSLRGPSGFIQVPVNTTTGNLDLGTLKFERGGIVSGRSGTRYQLTPDTLLAGSIIQGSVSFQNPLSKPLTNVVVRFKHGTDLALVPDGIRVEPGSASVVETVSGTSLKLENLESGQRVDLRFILEVSGTVTADNLTVPASVTFEHADSSITESLGVATIRLIREPTLSGPSIVPTPAIELNGRSRRGTIRVFDNGQLIGQTEVSWQGYWNLTAELGSAPVPYWHTVVAELTETDGTLSRSNAIEILHHPEQPRPTRIRFRQQTDIVLDAEQARLVQDFPDVGQWIEYEVPATGSASFWYRMLAGFPFEVEVEFNQPEDVRDLSFEISGPAGGIGRAARGEDGIFRTRIETIRDAVWQTGPFYAEYDTYSGVLSRLINDLDLGAIDDLPGSQTTAIQSTQPTDIGDPNPRVQGGRVPFDLGNGAFSGSFEYRAAPGPIVSVPGTVSVSVPGDTLEYPRETAPVLGGSVDISVTGSRVRSEVRVSLPIQRFLSRDTLTPAWPAGAAISLSQPTVSSVLLGWPRSYDDLWIQDYIVRVNGAEAARVPGGQRTFLLESLSPGSNYEVGIAAIDGSGKTGPFLALQFPFAGTDTQFSALPSTAFQEARPALLVELESTLRTANNEIDWSKVETLGYEIDMVGDLGTLLDIFGLLKGYGDAFDQVQRWEDMLDNIGNCAPDRRGELENAIFEAADMLLTANALGTSLTALGIAGTAAGVSAPLGIAVGISGLAIGQVLGDAAGKLAANAENIYESIKAANPDCEDEKDPRKRTPRRPIRQKTADPVAKIDPSGFVYEVTETNRLEGVTATLLEGETENGPWMVSAAEEFGEINPQITPAGGVYRWDVPAGWWQVMYQKDGYETAFSDVLPVPPPHFDVNIPLKSLAAPEVLGIDSLHNGAALRIDFANFIRATMASPDTVRLRDDQGDLLPGLVYAPDEELIDNPHSESTTRDIAKRLLFVPEQRLSIGDTYTVEIDGVIESYGELPLGETVSIEITINDDRSGTWFGSFSPGGGLWTMNIAGDGTASLSGYDPANGRKVDAAGSADSEGNLFIDLGSLAAGAVLTGSLTDANLTGSVSVLGYTVNGARSQGAIGAESIALTYHGAVIGSTGTTVTATVGPDGTTLVVIDGELIVTATSGSLDDQDQFSALLSDDSELELDLSDPDGGMSGVLSLVESGSWSILGAEQSLPNARLVNVSGRGPIGAGGSLIAGFVIRGSAENPMLIRAIGPGLETFGVDGRLERPRIRLVDQSRPAETNRIAENTNWLEAGNRAELRAVFAGLGAFFLEDAKADATVYLPVTPGPYTAVVQGLDGLTGITLVEAYDADLGVFGTTSQGVANLSLRGQVGTGSGVMIAGFVIEGNAPRRLLLRGIGPGLGTVGVTGFLGDPEITLFQGGDPIAENQTWGDALPNEGLAGLFPLVGAFPLESGSADAALVIWLAPGPYTLRLRNEAISQGVGLIEIYDMP